MVMRLQEYLALGGLLIVLLLASTVSGDYVYDFEAVLTQSNSVTIEQQTHYYDLFYIYSDGPAELTFNNYDANLISPYDNGEYSDPYLYLYQQQNTLFSSINSFPSTYVLFAEDDDSNEDVAEGLYFFLDNVMMTNHIVAMVTSYDPLTTGTVDFSIISDKQLYVSTIPEPQAVSMILTGGALLLLIKRKLD
jgi:hypothetical protein